MSYVHDVQKINDRLYCIKDVQSINKYLIVGSEKALVFDTGFGFTDFKPVIRELTDLDYYVVDSHSDVDHASGNYLFDEVYIGIHDYKNLSYIEDPEYRKVQVDYRISKHPALVDEMDLDAYYQMSAYHTNYRFLEGGEVFDLGDLKLEVIPIPGHTGGSVCLFERSKGWLFTGDSVMKYNVYYAQEQCEPLKVYYHSLKKLQTMENEVSTIFPGHGEYGIPAHFISDLMTNVEEILSQEEEDEFVNLPFGMVGYKHTYADTLIYYSKAQRDMLQAHGLS